MGTPVRPTASATALGASPRTPQRGISSTFSSPGFRTEEDTVIFEIGTRYLRSGLANNGVPRSVLQFGPEQSRRLGDYRKWLPGYEDRPRQIQSLDTWTKPYELWQLDSRDFDPDLMEDKIERLLRIAFTEHILMDAKGRKVVLVLPALTTHAILSKILTVMFRDLQISSATLVLPAIMSVVSAGQRSGLVIDIGWHETVITAVYEFREVAIFRSTRAMKQLLNETATLLDDVCASRPQIEGENQKHIGLDFQYVEQLMNQLVWCRTLSSQQGKDDAKLSVCLPLPSSKPVEITFASLSIPTEKALFAESKNHREQDDHEHCLDYMLYRSLLYLPPDIRSICMSRIMFTGGGANIPGLKTRLIEELQSTIDKRGWNKVWNSRISDGRLPHRPKQAPADQLYSNNEDTREGAAFEAQLQDSIEEKLVQASSKTNKAQTSGEIRAIESMGAFAGASITAALRVKSHLEIERELFLHHGLSGPKKEQESSSSRTKSLGGGLSKLPGNDSSSWTLGAWA